jgi:hypothetical protein
MDAKLSVNNKAMCCNWHHPIISKPNRPQEKPKKVAIKRLASLR